MSIVDEPGFLVLFPRDEPPSVFSSNVSVLRYTRSSNAQAGRIELTENREKSGGNMNRFIELKLFRCYVHVTDVMVTLLIKLMIVTLLWCAGSK